MTADRATAIGTRVFFFTAFLLLGIAAIRFVASLFDLHLAQSVAPGRLMEFATASAIFATALLLRQIRELLAKRKSD